MYSRAVNRNWDLNRVSAIREDLEGNFNRNWNLELRIARHPSDRSRLTAEQLVKRRRQPRHPDRGALRVERDARKQRNRSRRNRFPNGFAGRIFSYTRPCRISDTISSLYQWPPELSLCVFIALAECFQTATLAAGTRIVYN